MEGLILAWTGLLGACFGSFTNVVAWRLPASNRWSSPADTALNAVMPSTGMSISRFWVGCC